MLGARIDHIVTEWLYVQIRPVISFHRRGVRFYQHYYKHACNSSLTHMRAQTHTHERMHKRTQDVYKWHRPLIICTTGVIMFGKIIYSFIDINRNIMMVCMMISGSAMIGGHGSYSPRESFQSLQHTDT